MAAADSTARLESSHSAGSSAPFTTRVKHAARSAAAAGRPSIRREQFVAARFSTWARARRRRQIGWLAGRPAEPVRPGGRELARPLFCRASGTRQPGARPASLPPISRETAGTLTTDVRLLRIASRRHATARGLQRREWASRLVTDGTDVRGRLGRTCLRVVYRNRKITGGEFGLREYSRTFATH